MQNPNKIDVYLYSSKSQTFSSVDDAKLRRFYKNALELNNIKYITNPIDDNIKIVHFVKLEDYKKFNSFKNKKFIKIVNVFTNDKDNEKEIVSKVKNKETKMIERHIQNRIIDLLNEFDVVITPTPLTKKFLIDEGVTTDIEVLNLPVKLTKVDLKSSEIANIAYIYFHLEENAKFFLLLLDHQDKEAAERIQILASIYKEYRFLVCTGDMNSKSGKDVRKVFKRHPSNIIIATNVAEDVYYSALYRSEGVILLNNTAYYSLEAMEVLASKKHLLALETSVIKDMIIDKINGHVYNDFASLIQGIDELSKGKILDLRLNGYEFASKNRIQAIGEKLVAIYRKTLKENNQ